MVFFFGFGNEEENSCSYPSLFFDKLLALKCGLVFLLLSFSSPSPEPIVHLSFLWPHGVSSVFLRPVFTHVHPCSPVFVSGCR